MYLTKKISRNYYGRWIFQFHRSILFESESCISQFFHDQLTKIASLKLSLLGQHQPQYRPSSRVFSLGKVFKTVRPVSMHSGKYVGKNQFSKLRIINIFLFNIVMFIPGNILIPFIDILDRTK